MAEKRLTRTERAEVEAQVLADLRRERPDLAAAIDAARERRTQEAVRRPARSGPVVARAGTFEGITFPSRADLVQTRRDEKRAQALWREGKVKEAKAIGRTLLRRMYLYTGDRDNWSWLLGEWTGS